jgi:hypothetical protein
MLSQQTDKHKQASYKSSGASSEEQAAMFSRPRVLSHVFLPAFRLILETSALISDRAICYVTSVTSVTVLERKAESYKRCRSIQRKKERKKECKLMRYEILRAVRMTMAVLRAVTSHGLLDRTIHRQGTSTLKM